MTPSTPDPRARHDESAEQQTEQPAEHGGHDDGGGGGHGHHDPSVFRDRLLLSVVATVPILYLSERFQAWFGYEAVAIPFEAWLVPILGTVVYLYGGWPFLRGVASELADLRPAMMTLIALAITTAWGFSLAVALGFPAEAFWWELATLVDVMLLGHWIEMRSVQGASRALEELGELMPTTARRYLEDGGTEEIPPSELEEGDRLLVRPGESFPADGEVEEGASAADESFLTGESTPVSKSPGDEVAAGSVNQNGALTVRVVRTGEETALSQVMRLVQEARASRGRFQRLADRAAGWLAYIAVGAATATLLVWLGVGRDLTGSVALAVTVLVIACPHALGLAIPLVTANATALAANNGLLIRNRDALERAGSLRFVAFDKTGTLTEGVFAVQEVATEAQPGGDAEQQGDAGPSRAEALRIAATLEARSEHPIAAALRTAAEEAEADVGAEAEEFEVESGAGVRGRVDGRHWRVGRLSWASEEGRTVPDALQRAVDRFGQDGATIVALADEEGVRAVFALADAVRESAERTASALRERGIEPVMITGDGEEVALAVARRIGIERVYARVKPEDKVARVRELHDEGPVAFVGDGINDAAALIESDLGVAIGAGTRVAIESADVVLVNDDPEDVLRMLSLNELTTRKMRQNLLWATGYNVVAIPLAAGVAAPFGILLSPSVGALLMSASTVIVAINAMTMRRASLGVRASAATA